MHRIHTPLAAIALGLVLSLAAQAAEPPSLIPRSEIWGNPGRWDAKISPDGQWLSWLAPRDGVLNIWVAPANDLKQARAVTADTGSGIGDYRWSYQPGRLLYTRDNGGDENAHIFVVDVASGSTRDLTPTSKSGASIASVSPRHPGSIVANVYDRDPKWLDLVRIDLTTGQRTVLETNTREFNAYLVDGDYRVRSAKGTSKAAETLLYRPDGKGGWKEVERVGFEDSFSTRPFAYSQDGKTEYWWDARGRDTQALYAVNTATGKRRLLDEDARADLKTVMTQPRTGEVDAVRHAYLRPEWKAQGKAIAADLKRIAAIGSGNAEVESRSLDDRIWILYDNGPTDTGTYYRYDRDGKGGGTITRLFATMDGFDNAALRESWPQEIRARDGLTLPSYLTLPADADANRDGKPERAVPMVLLVHGGPWSRDVYGLYGEAQWLANRGYAVLQVNFRGSSGFGKRFLNAGEKQWAAKMHDDLIDAVDWAIAQGVTTRDQVAIMGGSYGGYATLVGMTFTPDRFKCGVDIVGPSNINTLLATVPPWWASSYEQWARRVGDPRTPEGRKLLEERSPLNRVDAIRGRLLIGQGANDARVKPSESEQIVKAMQAKNLPVTYVLFPDEGHGFVRTENNMAFYAVAEGFLGQCLGGRVQPIGKDLTGSSIGVPAGAEHVPGLTEALKTHVPVVRK